MRRAPAVLLAFAALVPAAAARESLEPGLTEPLPAPDAAIPRDPAALASTLTVTTRRLRAAIDGWDPAAEVPDDVTYLALYQQRMLRLMGSSRRLGDAALARVAEEVRGEARDTVVARRRLAAIPASPGRAPRVKVAAAAPAAVLRSAYAEAQRRFGVDWSVLAAVNFVESAFGRVRSASAAGARGPMQFLPATWRRYGMGGDIDDPHDAILGAANLLEHAGARRDLDGALYAYNHSTAYVGAVRRFAARMRADERSFLAYYAWQVYVGPRRVTGPGTPHP
ncbi:lytic transglycosylase domain-containing protein [Candidatus Solirubrobacter pratensis]|uniref:lytic transglycosylase domain-containing protein n=1 Tax=Candidatus Solirubrobacter pratensis TaxID=1298857 RepID=UPI0004037A71|nr:transglycosylase SLT domain-containing protein [Candidatus Solirubrobacter pratensis]